MKRMICAILSLSLMLCSCGRSSELIVDREPLMSIKLSDGANDLPAEKTIPICLGRDCKKYVIKGIEGETMINIDNLRSAIPKNECDMISASYAKNGFRQKMTVNPIDIADIDRVDVVCRGQKVKYRPTPTPDLIEVIDAYFDPSKLADFVFANPAVFLISYGIASFLVVYTIVVCCCSSGIH